LPYSLSITSHFSVTFTLAFIFFIAFNIIAIFLYKENFVCLFLPHGTPIHILPFIVLIEFISYLTRVLSLSIRLFANIISGHTLLKILGTFAFSILLVSSI
jgi:ATP synthase subunit 6